MHSLDLSNKNQPLDKELHLKVLREFCAGARQRVWNTEPNFKFLVQGVDTCKKTKPALNSLNSNQMNSNLTDSNSSISNPCSVVPPPNAQHSNAAHLYASNSNASNSNASNSKASNSKASNSNASHSNASHSNASNSNASNSNASNSNASNSNVSNSTNSGFLLKDYISDLQFNFEDQGSTSGLPPVNTLINNGFMDNFLDDADENTNFMPDE
jgi:hypothetical protein